ncbi:MAG: hypothetical protein IKZ59_05845 [Clostridia bacterium]|nr:hypothetical protein [Clostridia bacterium]
MKKAVFCTVLCLAVLFCAAGCKSGKEKKSVYGVNFAAYADAGEIPESKLKIGDSIPSFDSEETESEYFSMDSEEPPFFMAATGEFGYYYEKGDDPRIKSIMGYDTCFGFDNGTVSITVKEALDSRNIKYTEREPVEGEIFYMSLSSGTSVIECKQFKYRLVFVFSDNALCATYLGD